jgi:hypothetical protein
MSLRGIHTVATLTALGTLPVQGMETVAAGRGTLQAVAHVDFMVTIPRVVRLAFSGQPATLRITAEDAAAGEVRVDGVEALVVVNDPRGYVLQATLSGPFSAATIEGFAAPVQLGNGEATVPMPSMVGKHRPQPRRIHYRFDLAKGTAPGVYAWPLALAVATP